MDGLAIAASITEAKGAILGGVIRTIYQPEFGTFVLHLFAGGDRRLLLSPGRAALHLTNLDLAYPQRPSPFTMLLRKHLRGGRIVGIEQSGWDRVVNLTVERRQGENLEAFHVIVELLGVRGNLILLRDYRVLAALRPGTRVVSGAVYQPLPSQKKIDPSKITLALLEEILEQEEPVRALVHHVDGIGRKTAEAIITRAQARADGSFAEGIRESLSFLLVRVKEPQAEVDRATNSASFFPLVPPGERYPSFSAALDAEWGERHEAVQNDGAQKPLREGILRAIAKRERTVKKLKEWLAKADAAETLQQHADLIMIHQSTLTRRMREATLLDPARGERVAIPLNPRLNPIENAQALYERAKRLRRGRPIVTQRLRRLEGEIARLREGVATLESGAGLSDDLLALIPTPRTRKTPPPPTAPRVFAILGYTVQVGKDAAQNDALLRSASPEDLWLHAKGVPGSHVFVRHHGRRTGYPPEVVRKAALLAARVSKAREERWVEVSYTTVKHVRKPKGSPPGLVILSKEETLTVDLRTEEEGE
jgi:predicted ribosome quality control (RQC) complex YloA/Tae2 family protein